MRLSVLAQLSLFIVLAALTLVITTKRHQEQGADFLLDDKINASSINAGQFLSETPHAEELPVFNIESQSAFARELNGKEIFYELNPNRRWPIASLTKLMTAVVALEMWGRQPTVTDSIKIMILISSNEAAEQLADRENKDLFVAAMNEKARELDMYQTSFFDATGLSFLNQSTATDLYKLVSYISRKHPQILQWSREKELLVSNLKYTNINQFSSRPDFLGGKTGYTDEASGNLISVFTSKQKPIIIIILGAANKIERYAQTENLLEWVLQYYRL